MIWGMFHRPQAQLFLLRLCPMTDIPVSAGGTAPPAASLLALSCGEDQNQRQAEGYEKNQNYSHSAPSFSLS